MRKINEYIYNWLNTTYTVNPEILSISRILYCIGIIVLGIPQFSIIGSFDPLLFNPPPSIAKLFGLIKSPLFWELLDVLIRLAFISLLLGLKTRLSSLLFGGLVIFGYSFYFSFGKIDHNIFAWLLPVIMSFTCWGANFSVDSFFKKKETITETGWPLSILSFLIGWGYLTSGIQKILGGWYDPNAVYMESFLARYYYFWDKDMYLIGFLNELNSHLAYKVMDYSGLIFECFIILTIFKASYFLKAVGASLLFHISILLSLNIAFSYHLLVFIPFICLYFLPERLKGLYALFQKVYKPLFLLLGFLLCFVLLFEPSPFDWIEFRSHYFMFFLGLIGLFMLLPKGWLNLCRTLQHKGEKG